MQAWVLVALNTGGSGRRGCLPTPVYSYISFLCVPELHQVIPAFSLFAIYGGQRWWQRGRFGYGGWQW